MILNFRRMGFSGALAGAILALAATFAASVSDARAQSLVATVNDSPVTNYDLEQRVKLLRVLRAPIAGLADLVAQLQARGAVLKLPPQGLAQTLDEGLRQLVGRGLVGTDLRPRSDAAPVLAFYAAPVWQRLEPAYAATRQT